MKNATVKWRMSLGKCGAKVQVFCEKSKSAPIKVE